MFPALEYGGSVDSVLMGGPELVQEDIQARVRTQVVLKGESTLPLDVRVTVTPGEDAAANLRVKVVLGPEGLTFERIKREYDARVDLTIRILEKGGQVVSEMSETLPIHLTQEQLDRSHTFSLLHESLNPAIAGDYTVDVIALDYCAGSFLTLGDTERARQLFSRSLSLDRNQPEVESSLRQIQR